MLKVRVKRINAIAGGPKVALLNEVTAQRHVIKPMDRIRIISHSKSITAIVNISPSIPEDEIWLYEDVWREFDVKDGEEVLVALETKPRSTDYIKKKLNGYELTKNEIFEIVKDIVQDRLSEIEQMAFVVACQCYGMTFEETIALTEAIAETGEKVELGVYPVADKHCIGGVPNNRTTMILVPIVAAYGVHIPKLSSRAITSPAGTADTMEVLARVDLSAEEIKEVVLKTKGCIAWGGGTNIAAADDKLIRLRRPLSLDPVGMVLASVLAKKKAVGATHVIIDIPVGKEVKVKNYRDGYFWKNYFEMVGKMLKMKIKAILTDGSQPIGNGIGPALEARDVIWILKRDSRRPLDLEQKVISLAGQLLELIGKVPYGEGDLVAREILESGKAWEKMREIIEAQGGNPDVKEDELPIGQYTYDVESPRNGFVVSVSNATIAKIARYAGAPFDKGAGVYLFKKKGDYVKAGETIMRIYAESEKKLDDAIKILEERFPFVIE